MPTILNDTGTGGNDVLTQGNGNGWYIISYPDVRTGAIQIDYDNAPSRTAAGQFNPGTTVIGGPYPTEAAAEAAFNGSAAGAAYNANPENPTGSGASGSSNEASTTSSQPTQLPGWLDFLGRLTSASLWERVGEVVLGLVLIAMGVAHITHAVPVAEKVAKVAGTAALV